MAWDIKYSQFNVIKGVGTKVLTLHRSLSDTTQLTLPKTVSNAVWMGNVLSVTLIDGKVRRYTSHDNYSIF